MFFVPRFGLPSALLLGLERRNNDEGRPSARKESLP
jgi:hypothetical protein